MPIPDVEALKGAAKAEAKAWLKGRSKFMSGFCNENGKPGQHEGTKPLGMKTCPFFDSCPCECHKNVDALFDMTGMPRIEIPNPLYKPDLGDFAMPYVPVHDPTGVAFADGGVIGPDRDEEPVAANVVAPATPLAERRTETGRAARGGLEAQVWDACRHMADPITPKLVGEWIVEKYRIPTPSSGAINAVWDRWTKMGYCEQAKKPNRFLKFTGDGSWEELARLKAAAKREKKQVVTNQRRGIR